MAEIQINFNSLPENPATVVLTGSGISAESGLETFRNKDGIWSRYRVEEVATPQAFTRNPDKVHEFYNLRRRSLLAPGVKPNKAHEALARLEKAASEKLLIVTQNVDDLHERAGNHNLIHMHGELLKSLCVYCRDIRACRHDLETAAQCATCSKSGGLRPSVVWFGEMPLEMERIYRAVESCDLFLSVGTSGYVYPAAGLAGAARQAGALVYEINLEPSENAMIFHDGFYGPAGENLPAFVDLLLESRF